MIYFLLFMMFDLITYTFIFKDLQDFKKDILANKEDIVKLKIKTDYLLYGKKED